MEQREQEFKDKDDLIKRLTKPHGLVDLKPHPGSTRNRDRAGRGHAAGKGKQAGRGQSGQKKRSTVRIGFEGGQNPWYRRLPKRGFNSLNQVEVEAIGLGSLERVFEVGSVVDLKSLRAKGLFKGKACKILANGNLTKKLFVKGVKISKTAAERIKQLGGDIS